MVSACLLTYYEAHFQIFYMLTLCQEKGIKDDMRVLLGEQARNVGLLVSLWFVNLPPQLVCLFEANGGAPESFRFKSYLLVSKIYKVRLYHHYLLLKSTLVSHDHKNADKKNRLTIDSEEAIIYVKPED